MENIVKKVNLLSYSENEKASLDKFMTALSDAIISYDELERIVNYLKENGITITKPSQNKIFASGYDRVYEVVEEYKKMGLISALVEDPLRINATNSVARIKYMMANGFKLTKPNGKFLKKLFSKRLFEKEYGELQEVEVAKAEDTVPEFDPLAADMYHGKDTDDISRLFEIENNINEYEAVLSSPQVPADDDAINRFDILYQYTGKILQKLYNTGDREVSVPDNVCTCLMKLVSDKMPDDNKVLFYALTYGKTLSDIEIKFIKNKIKEVLKDDIKKEDVIELESIV